MTVRGRALPLPLLLLLPLLLVLAASGPVIRKATQTEVDSGTNNSAFVTPLTLASKAGAFTGNLSSATNLNGANIVWPTNAGSTATINMAVPWAAVSTNNNMSFSGFTGLDTRGTNVQAVTRIYTNSAGSSAVKTITMPAGCIDLLNTGLTLYNTNQGVLTVAIYPGMGTNFSWIGK